MAFINTNARFKFTQFTGRKGEMTSTINGVDALHIEVDRDLPFRTISAVAAVGLMRRSSPRVPAYKEFLCLGFCVGLDPLPRS